MKIAFYRVLNSTLPEPYKGLQTDVLYLTNTGYVYPEGANKPIDICDPEFIAHLTENPATTIDTDNKIEIPKEIDNDMFIKILSKNKELLQYIFESKYATVKGCMRVLNFPRDATKEKLELLENGNILGRYGSFFVIKPEIKALLEFELDKDK